MLAQVCLALHPCGSLIDANNAPAAAAQVNVPERAATALIMQSHLKRPWI